MNTPVPVPSTVGATPWYTSQVMIGTIVTILATMVGVFPKLGQLLGFTSTAVISNDVTAICQAIAFLAGVYTAIKRASASVQPLTLTQAAADIHPATKAAQGQSGFARVSLLALLALVTVAATVVMTGCKTVPIQTFNQLVLTAGTVDDTVVNALDAAVKAKAITGAQATAALKITDAAQAALVTANTAYQAGNQSTANAYLVGAASALTAVQACLVQPATFTVCLQGVSVP